jgi:hypothetical protein
VLDFRRIVINRKLLQWFSGLGAIFFGFIFLATVLLQKPLEKTAVEFLTKEVAAQINTKIDGRLGLGKVEPNIAQKTFLAKYEEDVAILKGDIERVSTAVTTALLHKNDAKPTDIFIAQIIATLPMQSKLWEYKLIKVGLQSLDTEVVSRYEETWSSLVVDIRMFSAVNAGSFCLVLLLAFLVKEIPHYLSFCAWLLLFSTLVSIIIYLYGQNWFYTILFNKYYGTGYLTMLGCIFGYLLFRGSFEYGIYAAFEKADK